MEQNIKDESNIRNTEDHSSSEEQIDFSGNIGINNAGLCLLSPWFPFMMKMAGYLKEDNSDFKDTASKIRAVFLLQYLTCSEEKAYKEEELAFNRVLVSLSTHIALPESLPLTMREKQLGQLIVDGVKNNCTKMDDLKIEAFQHLFIIRNANLEQREDKWLMTVEEQSLDHQLRFIQWEFRLIHFPWMKKELQVVWG